MAAGFNPESFWAQSPRSFVAIMEGAARAAHRRADANTILAYQALSFYGLAMSKKLKPLKDYLIEKPRPKRKQTPEEMLAALQMFAAGGAPITIRQVN